MVVGDYDLIETYGVVSGPLVKGLLSGRAVGVKRVREGYYDDKSGNPDPGNYGDENYALSFRLTPTENIEMNIRGNERSYARRMAGADAAGVINLTENGGRTRNTTDYVFGYRAVDPNLACPNALTRTTPVATPGVLGGTGCAVAGNPVLSFTHPSNGSTVFAQRVTPGFDQTTIGTINSPNIAFGADASRQNLVGVGSLDGDDLVTDTNGQQDEFFDHQAVSFDASWTVSDQFSMKYIFGYTDYFYDRTSDVDLTSNPIFDNTFYVSQETEYVSHELQFFIDPSENLSITAGLFAYDAKITQRGDYFDANCRGNTNCASRYSQDFPIPLPIPAKTDLFTARLSKDQFGLNGTSLPGCVNLNSDQIDVFCFGSWTADRGDRVQHGPATIATNLEYQTRSERYAYAAYGQSTYTFNEKFALTVGLRWARDQLDGAEDVFYYAEETIVPLGFSGCNDTTTPTCQSDLGGINQALGYVGPNGEILNPNRVLVAGMPTSISLTRDLYKATEGVTWRANIDYTPNEDDLIYLSATKGLRSGGMNLVFFSSNATYDGEELVAYELGYKGTKLDGRLQLNASVYLYDYENVHTFSNGASFAGGYTTNVIAVPKGEMKGVELDATWLAGDNFTLGANFSLTKSKYKSDVFAINPIDENAPESLFDPFATQSNLNGNQMIRVPEMKTGAYAQYTWPMAENGKLDFLVNYSWIDRVYFTVYEDKNHSAPSYDRFDVRSSWISADDAWTVAVFVNNVFDKIGIRQIDQYQATESTNWRRTGAVSDPRLFGLEVRYKFGAYQ